MRTLFILGLLCVLGCSNATVDMQEEETYPIAVVKTRLGTMHFWLYNQTPKHKAKFIELANEGHYNQFTFNRVIKNFVIQGGCPDSVSYFENSPYLLDPEFVDSLRHEYGALGMGRDDNPGKQSNACQFYIVNKESGLPNLDGEYMIFGQLIGGEEVLEAIEKETTNHTDTPLEAIPLDVHIRQMTESELVGEFDYKIQE